MAKKKAKENSENVQARAEKHSDKLDGILSTAAGAVINTGSYVKGNVKKSMDSVMNRLDINGDGQVGIDDIIVQAIKMPGVRIDRTGFLQKEFF